MDLFDRLKKEFFPFSNEKDGSGMRRKGLLLFLFYILFLSHEGQKAWGDEADDSVIRPCNTDTGWTFKCTLTPILPKLS